MTGGCEGTKGLGNKNQFVRLWCAHALGLIGRDAASLASVLAERAGSDVSVNVRDVARAALTKVRLPNRPTTFAAACRSSPYGSPTSHPSARAITAPTMPA